MKIIDLHTHILSPEVIRDRARYLERDGWFRSLYQNPKARLATADELVADMDRDGVDQAVTFGFAWADEGLCRASNDYVAEAIRRYPDRLIGFAVVNPRSGAAAIREVERCVELGFRGVGELLPDGQGYTLDEADVLDPLLNWLEEQGLPLLAHTNEPVGHAYCGKGCNTPEVVYRLAKRHPRATLICAHWGGGLPFYELMPEVRRVLARVYYDTAASPFLYDSSIFALAARIIRPKILFATDYPLLGYPRALRHLRAAELAEDDLARILGGNAEQLLWPPEQT